MGRLSDLFDNHRGDVEESVKKALERADDTLEALRRRLEEVESRLRDVAGEAPLKVTEQQSDVVTSSQVGASNEQLSAKKPRSKK
jgi:hypothetical protein